MTRQFTKKYADISCATRAQFIKLVESRQTTIKEAASRFGIKFSTSKAILQIYRKEGRIGKKTTRSRAKCERQIVQEEGTDDNNLQPNSEIYKQQPVLTPSDFNTYCWIQYFQYFQYLQYWQYISNIQKHDDKILTIDTQQEL